MCTRWPLAAATLLALLPTGSARAAPPSCDTLTNPLYLQVGDTQANLMKRLGRALRDNTPHPITLVYVTSGSCTNIDAIVNRTAITLNMSYVPSTTEDPNWLPTSPVLSCTPPTGGVVPDIANSNVFVSACPTALPATVTQANGPVQAYVLAVPKASSQTAITFEEAYFVFGFGMMGMIMPWVDETQYFIRTVTKSTLLSWAANITVPAAKWKGVRFDGSPAVVGALQTAATPEAAIGILGAEVYDANRQTLTSLAFRAKDQYAAYYPDSTSTASDKQNVRDGHYTVWSPTVWMETVDGGGAPVKADAHYVIELLRGHDVTPMPNFDPATPIAKVGLVPDCAMRVTRSFEGGPLSLYTPTASCTCRYESLVASNTCALCPTGTCTTGVCRGGYCEER
jgi:hypothetical protein